MRRLLSFTARFLMCLLFMANMQSCCIHLWPDPPEPENPTLVLHLRFNPDMYVWEHLYDADTEKLTELHPEMTAHPGHPGTSDQYDNSRPTGYIRHIVRIYPEGDPVNYIDEVEVNNFTGSSYDCDILLDLPLGRYDIVVWSDLRENSFDSHFHNAGNFLSINLVNHQGNNDYRDAFRGRCSIVVNAEEIQEATVDMWRPIAKYEFVATDLADFIDRETTRTKSSRANIDEYTVTFIYPHYMPSSFSAIDDRLVDSTTGVSFSCNMKQIADDEVSLGFDYVMINSTAEKGSSAAQNVTVQVQVSDAMGEVVARSTPISVPLRRDDHTVIRSKFLSEKAEGGVAIDPDYDGDHNIFQ